MYRLDAKPSLDRATPTYIQKSSTHNNGMPSYLRQKPLPERYDHSPVIKPRKDPVQPSYRSANLTKSELEPARMTSTSQNLPKDKPQKQGTSLQDIPLLTKESQLPFYEPTKCSSNRNGIIKAYAANTNQGIVRDYNEDRVSIILNIVKPQSRQDESWPKCSFFGVYDGHGGAACADFLRDNLHQFVIREYDFPWNPYEALKKGFEQAEKTFLDLALKSYAKGQPERSGSCAIVSLIVGDTCFIANVGDSRAVLSSQNGRQTYSLSRDHKPCDELEQKRIQTAGGQIYQTQQQTGPEDNPQIIYGPLRVLPGRLSVSRTFGDIEAKLEQFGGNPKVVCAEPEIRSFKIQQEHDFIVLASDGIFDKMSSQDVLRTIWDDMRTSPQLQNNLHAQISSAVEAILKESINRRTFDNITVVIVAFQKDEEKQERQERARQERPRTIGSVERDNSVQSISPTPISKKVINHPYFLREDKPYHRGSVQSAKAMLNQVKPLRGSLDQAEQFKRAQNKNQMQYPNLNSSLQFIKQNPNRNRYDENQENYQQLSNKPREQKQSSQHVEMKVSNDFRTYNQQKKVMPAQDYNNRYLGRIV